MKIGARAHLTLQIVVCCLTLLQGRLALGIVDGSIEEETRSSQVRPLIIGHRGSCGILPEHTLEGYNWAIDQGADFIECDVVITKDQQLICSHDVHLSETTNVADLPQFANRLTTRYIPEEGNITDWFTFDFTLKEIKQLRRRQREGRNPQFDGRFQIPTFIEFIKVAQKTTSRKIGIYPETKHPELFNEIFSKTNFRFEDQLINTMHAHGYKTKDDLCFVQSFSKQSLEYTSKLTEIPLIMLLEKSVDENFLKEISTFCYGIGTWKNLIVPHWNSVNGYRNSLGKPTDLIELAHSNNLSVHAFTFRNENDNLAWDYGMDPYLEYEFYLKLGVDGFFTDFPGTLARFYKTQRFDSIYADTIHANSIHANSIHANSIHATTVDTEKAVIGDLSTKSIRNHSIHSQLVNAQTIQNSSIHGNRVHGNIIRNSSIEAEEVYSAIVEKSAIKTKKFQVNSVNNSVVMADEVKAEVVNANSLNAITVNTKILDAKVIQTDEIHSDIVQGNEVHTNILEGKEVHAQKVYSHTVQNNTIHANAIRAETIQHNTIHAHAVHGGAVQGNIINAHEVHTTVVNGTELHNNTINGHIVHGH